MNFGRFEQDRAVRGARGLSYNKGGLNKEDIVEILKANGQSASRRERRNDLETRLQRILDNNDNTGPLKDLSSLRRDLPAPTKGKRAAPREPLDILADAAVQRLEELEAFKDEQRQGRLCKLENNQPVHTFVLRHPARLNEDGIRVKYLVDSGAGDKAEGAIDIPQEVLRELEIPTRKGQSYKMADGKTVVTYKSAKVHVEYEQPNGQTRSEIFTASVRHDLKEKGSLPLFGNYAIRKLKLTIGGPIE